MTTDRRTDCGLCLAGIRHTGHERTATPVGGGLGPVPRFVAPDAEQRRSFTDERLAAYRERIAAPADAPMAQRVRSQRCARGLDGCVDPGCDCSCHTQPGAPADLTVRNVVSAAGSFPGFEVPDPPDDAVRELPRIPADWSPEDVSAAVHEYIGRVVVDPEDTARLRLTADEAARAAGISQRIMRSLPAPGEAPQLPPEASR